MTNRNIFSFSVAFIILAMIAASASGQTVTGALAEATVARGSTAKGTIILSLPEGLHVNSNKPSSEYLIPTSVRISGVGLKPAVVEYPEGTNRKFQFSESELNVYEGEITIPFRIVIPKKLRSNKLALKAHVRYQACTDEVCYPPKNKELTMTVTLK